MYYAWRNNKKMAAKLLFVGIFTLIVYVVFLLYQSHKKHLSFSSLLWPFCTGGLSTIPLFILSQFPLSEWIYFLPGIMVVILPLAEEISKGYLALWIPPIINPSFLGGIVGLGFAAIENIAYSLSLIHLQETFISIYIIRLLLDSTAHFLFTSLFFYYGSRGNMGKAILYSSTAHIFFNVFVSTGLYIGIAPLFLIIYFLFEKTQKERIPVASPSS